MKDKLTIISDDLNHDIITELEARKQLLILLGVSGSFNIDEIKKAIHKFKKEELPDAESPYHFEAEIWSGMKSFLRWLESNDR